MPAAVLIGTSDAEVVAYDSANGEEKWRTKVSSEVLAPPRIDRSTAVIRTGDGKLFGLNVETGKRKWIYDRSIPTLTLRGTSPPIIHDGLVIAGFDNGRLAALDFRKRSTAVGTTNSYPEWPIRSRTYGGYRFRT